MFYHYFYFNACQFSIRARVVLFILINVSHQYCSAFYEKCKIHSFEEPTLRDLIREVYEATGSATASADRQTEHARLSQLTD